MIQVGLARAAHLHKALTCGLLNTSLLRLISPLDSRSNHIRYASGEAGANKQSDKESPKDLIKQTTDVQDVPEEEFSIANHRQGGIVPVKPLMSIGVESRIRKVEKKGSFSADLFSGGYDEDFLAYPEILDNRGENQALKLQGKMVQQLWPQIWEDPGLLKSYNFYSIYQLSVTEMMSVFEGIGASTKNCYATNMVDIKDLDHSAHQHRAVTKAIISLIIRNCLTYWPMWRSENEKIRSLLPQQIISLGGKPDPDKLFSPLGFCWTEQAEGLGSLPAQEWLTLGQQGGTAVDAVLIQGKKTRILYEPSREFHLLFYKDKTLSAVADDAEYPAEEPNPASDPFIGCCLVHDSELSHSQIYHDSAGFEYTDVEIDTTIPSDRLVFPAVRRDPRGLNIKALGQTAVGAIILGILKDALRTTYAHLATKKPAILTCDIIERKLSSVTTKIFAIESIVYYVAGMYDGLKDGFDAHMEATILKIVANEYAYEAIQELQQVCGSDLTIVSKLQDQINVLDTFLDGNIYNRLYLSTMGILWYARNMNVHLNQLRLKPWYPGYMIKQIVRTMAENRDLLTLNTDIYGSLHPSLKPAAVNLEYLVKRVKFASEEIIMDHGKDVTAAQSALYRLAQLSIDVFVLTTVCARASKSYSNGSRNAEQDVTLAIAMSEEMMQRVQVYLANLGVASHTIVGSQTKMINELNIKGGGYYAESPLDPNI